MQYCIFCYKHTPLKLKRFLETKSKKYKKEIMKFCHSLEKFHDNYNYEQKLKETNISDKKKFIQNYISRIMKENKKKDKDFISHLLAYMKRLPEYLFQINLIKKLDTNIIYTLADTKIPKKIHLKTNIPRSDEIWKNFKYKNLNPAQLYKRYRKIIVGTKMHKNINSIKKLGSLKEIADMRAIKKLMNIENDEDFHEKERTYETRKLKPMMIPKLTQSQLHLTKKTGLIKNQQLILEELPLEPDNTLYCYCQKVYKDGEKMIACDTCDEWLHFECIGYTGEVESKFSQELKFICPKCDEKDEENIRVERRKEYEKLFLKYYKEQRMALGLNLTMSSTENERKNNAEDKIIILDEEKPMQKEKEFVEINNIIEKENELEILQEQPEIEEIKEQIPHEIIEREEQEVIFEEPKNKNEVVDDDEKLENNHENCILIKIDQEEKIDGTSSNENDREEMTINTEKIEKNKTKKPSIEFNCITKKNLQSEPSNNFGNQKITKYFVPRNKLFFFFSLAIIKI